MAYKTLDEIIDICVRQGKTFEASREVSLAASETKYSVFRTGSKPVILFNRAFGYSGAGINVFMYRDPTYAAPEDVGTLETTIRNPNDTNAQTATVQLYAGTAPDTLGVETRTPARLFAGTSPTSNGEPIKTIGRPQLVLPNKDLLLFFTNRSGSTAEQVTALLEWAEPDRIPGVIIQNGQFVAYNGASL